MNKDTDSNTSFLAMRDRILAYLYQMDMGATESLGTALKTLEKPEIAGQSEAIESLFAILDERGANQEEAALFALAADKMLPPLNRQSMVSEGWNISILDFLARIITGGFRPLKKKDAQ